MKSRTEHYLGTVNTVKKKKIENILDEIMIQFAYPR